MESLRGGLSSRSPHRFPRFSQLEPFSLYNPPRVSFSSGRQAETALISRLARRVPLQGTRYSRLRGERNALWFSSRRRPLSSLDRRPLHFPTFHVATFLSTSSWQTLVTGGNSCSALLGQRLLTKPACYYVQTIPRLPRLVYLAAFRGTVRSERSIGLPISHSALDQFLNATC